MKHLHSLQLKVIFAIMFILFSSNIISASLICFLYMFGFAPLRQLAPTLYPFITVSSAIILGTFLTFFVVKRFLQPLDELINATNEITHGNFDVRVKPDTDDIAQSHEITTLQNCFNEMAEELQSIELLRNDFINDFSHEFKTPIVSIRGFAKQLKNTDLTPEQRAEYIDIIFSEADRLAKMSSNILLLTKYESQQIVTSKEAYSLDEQIRRCVLLLEKQWSEKNIELILNLDEITIVENEEMLSHVFINIIANAIKFSDRNGCVEISCRRDRKKIIVTISDNGIGMDEATQKRIFNKFYQADKSHSKEGNGLGLSLAKRVVDLCGGTITVDSAPGHGTSFVITFFEENSKGES